MPGLRAGTAIEIAGNGPALGKHIRNVFRFLATCFQHVFRPCHRMDSAGGLAIILLVSTAGCGIVSAPSPTPTSTAPTLAATAALPTATATHVPRTASTPTAVPTEVATSVPTATPPSPQITLEPTSPLITALRPDAQARLAELASLSHYAINVDIDYANLEFAGSETVAYTNTEDTPLDELVFRLFPNAADAYGNGSMTVSDITVDGQPAETELTLNDTALHVGLTPSLQPGTAVEVALDFRGVVPRDFGGDGRTGYGIYNFADGVLSLAGWYPVLAVYDDEGWNVDPASPVGDSVYSDAAFYTVNVTLADDVRLAATGVPVDQTDADGATRYSYVSGPARDFYMAASPDFQVASDTVDGIDVNSYYLPGQTSGGEAALEIAADALDDYNTRFGPYPYTELDVVAAPLQGAGGVEYPGVILIGAFLYDNPDDLFFTIATSHEVAHQWWYNTVGNDVIDEPWLDEALTSYASLIYLQDAGQAGAAEQVLGSWQRAYANVVAKGEDAPIIAPLSFWEEPGNSGRYGVIVYEKGPLFFDAVREEIGDDAFFQALRDYYSTQAFEIGTPEELLSAFEAAAGRQLDALYEEWLFADGK